MPRYYKNKIYTQDERSIIAGYQKGKIEVDTIIDIQRYDGNSSYAWEKNQRAKAASAQMRKQSAERQKIF